MRDEGVVAMKELNYKIAKVIYRLKHNDKEVINNYFRHAGMRIGKGVNICCNIMTPEPYLIEIGDNVTIAGDVEFITHDNSISKVLPGATDLFGKIMIGNNCFIGARSTILYGVELADNIIVASARVISTWENFLKSKHLARGRKDIQRIVCEHPEVLVKRKSKG